MHPLSAPRAVRRAAALVVALCIGCIATDRTGPVQPVRATIGIARGPDVAIEGALVAGPVVVTAVRVVLTGQGGGVAKDTLVVFPDTATTLVVELLLPASGEARTFAALAQFRNGGDVLLESTGSVTARPFGEQSEPVVLSAPVPPAGRLLPDAITVQPRDTTLFQGDSLLLRVAGTRAGTPLASFVHVQSPADTGVRVGPQSGYVRAPARRGGAFVRVRVPGTSLVDSVLVRYQPRPSGVLVVSGNNQSAPVATALPQPLVARVVGPDGLGVRDVKVTFAAPLVTGAAVGATFVTTDTTGVAQTTATLGQVAQGQSFSATVPGVSPTTFAATATPGAPSALVAVVGAAQDGQPGAVLPDSLVVRLLDAFDNGVPGRTVTFEPTGGTLTRLTATTDAQGRASAGQWTLPGTFGGQAVTATVTGVAPATFQATTGAGVPTFLTLAGVGGATDTIEAQRAGLTATLRDGMSQPVAGRVLRLRPKNAQNGTIVLGDSTGTTSAAGSVTFAGRWQLGTTPGADTLYLLVDGAPTVRDSAIVAVTAGQPSTLARVAGDGQSGPAGAPLPTALVVGLSDRRGNALAGQVVTFTASGGGAVQVGSATTDAAGAASAGTWTLGTSGAQSVTANVSGGPNTTFTATIAGGGGGPMTWSELENDRPLHGVACAGPTTCFAVGNAVAGVLRWTGSDWTTESIGPPEVFFGIACAAATDCVVVGENGAIRRWNGTSWAPQASGTGETLQSVACPTTTDCVAVGENGTIRRWNGSAWVAQSSGTTALLYGVTCVSVSDCAAVGDSGTIRRWNGSTWNAQTSGTSATLSGVACTAATDCVAVGSGGTIRRWNGSAWATQTSGTTSWLDGVACASASDCMAVGGVGTVRRWTGSSWVTLTSGTTNYLSDVACVSATNCVAVGFGSTIRRWNGSAWNAQVSRVALLEADCPSASSCVVVGLQGAVRRWNGSSWQGESSGTSATLVDVSCPTATDCVAVGFGGVIVRWNGTTWAPQSSGTTDNLLGVACPGPNDCVATGQFSGQIRRWNGATWLAQAAGTTLPLDGVACASISDCVAVGDNGTVVRWTGSAWLAQPSGTFNKLFSVTCVSSSYCVAVGTSGTIIRWDGFAWGPQVSGTFVTLLGVSCRSTSDCVATGENGVIRRWDGTSWVGEFTGTTVNFLGAQFVNPSRAIVFGDGGWILGGVR
ncbi:MAG: hypothetical protein ACK6DK_12030 [Gemmatimonadota bacterium]